MTKIAKRSVKKSKKIAKKRSIRHKIVKNNTVKSNTVKNNTVKSNNVKKDIINRGARSQMLNNIGQIPIIPQTPNNVNWDNINNMRNRNNDIQQEINDNKKSIQTLEADNKRLEKENKETKEKFKNAATENERLKRDAENNKELEKELRKLQHQNINLDIDYQINEKLGQVEYYKALIEEQKQEIIKRKKELELDKTKQQVDNLTKESNDLDNENKTLQEQIKFYKSDKGQTELKKAIHANELMKKRHDMYVQSAKLQKENQKMRLQLAGQLTEDEIKNLNETEYNNLKGLVQESVRLENELKEKQQKIADYNNLKDRRIKLENEKLDTDLKLTGVQAEHDYLNTIDGMEMEKIIIKNKKHIAETTAKIDMINNINKTNEEVKKNNIALDIAYNNLNNTDLNDIKAVNVAQEIFNQAVEKANKTAGERDSLIRQIYEKRSMINNDGHIMFLQSYPMYTDIHRTVPLTGYTIQYLSQYLRDLTDFIRILNDREKIPIEPLQK